MSSSRIFFVIIALIILAAVISLLRSRKLREKYAGLWIVVGVAIVVLSLAPDLLGALAGALGIVVPSNLLFALALILLLGVTLHLSLEISRLEDETRVLAENVAVLNLIVRENGLEDLTTLGGGSSPADQRGGNGDRP